MVLVKHLLCTRNVMFNLRALLPGDAQHPIDVTPDNGGLSGHRGHHLELLYLTFSFLFRFGRHSRIVHLGLQLLYFARSILSVI